jgi:hypothetical protein
MSYGSQRPPFAKPPFGDELDAEPTRMDDSLLSGEIASESTAIAPEPDTPYLVCEAGADLGREFPVAWGDTTVGRAVENEAVLKDLSVSRRHLRVIRDPRSGLRLRDLGSGNGSLLNGVRVDEAPLRDGDRISLGETVLRVRVPNAATAGQPRVYLGSGFAGAAAAPPLAAPIVAPQFAPQMPTPQFVAPSPMAVAVPSMHVPSYAAPAQQPMVAPAVSVASTRPLSALSAEEAGRIADHGAPQTGDVLGRPGAPLVVSPSMPSAPLQPSPSATMVIAKDPKAEKKRNLIMLGGAVLVAGLAIGAAALQSARNATEETPTETVQKPPMEAGLDALRARRWDEAEAAFRQVPDSPATRDEVERALQGARDGRIHEGHIASARQSIQSGDPRGALNYLGMVSGSSPLSGDADALRREARESLIVKLINEAKSASDQGRTEESRRKLTEASMLAPGHPAVERALTELATLEAAAPVNPSAPVNPPTAVPAPVVERPQAPVAERPTPQRTPTPAAPAPRRLPSSSAGGLPLVGDYAAPPTSRTSGASASSSSAISVVRRAVVDLYRVGNFTEAARRARESSAASSGSDRSGLAELATQVDQFSRDYARVRAASSNPSSVVRQIQNCVSLDQRISGGAAYKTQLEATLVDAYVSTARDALGRDEWTTACSRAQQAAGLSRTNAAARELVQRCERKANELVAQALSLERTDANRARETYRTATLLAPPSSGAHRTATQRMENLR